MWGTLPIQRTATTPIQASRIYGAVNYEYSIGKYEVSLVQYTRFLNAVAASDPHNLYNRV